MGDPLCRVSIHSAARPGAVDLVLPRHAEVGLLLPDIVDLVTGDRTADAAPQGWRLDRLCGARCDESMTLLECGVSDGEVMMLSPVGAPAPGPLPEDPFRTVCDTAAGPDPHREVPAVLWACPGLVAVIALGYSGTRGGAPMVAAGTAALSAAACFVAAWRQDAMRTILHLLAVGFIGLAGFLAVPVAGGVPGVALGASAGCAAAVWLRRTAGGDLWLLTGVATACAAVAVVTVFALLVPVGITASGAALGMLSLGLLGASARITLVLTGLRPAFPSDRDDTDAGSVSQAAAVGGRAVFSGVVAGSAAAATLAAGAIAVGCLGDSSWPKGFALAAVLAALLLLRARFYADPRCRAALGWGGLISAATAVALATVSAPRYAGPAVVLAVGVATWCWAGRGRRASSWARAGDAAEYILLAASVPLACWAAGLYELVRSLSVG